MAIRKKNKYPRQVRRRPVYLSAGCLVCAATASLAAYTWLVPGLAPATRQTVSFLPLVSVVLTYTAFGIGYGPIVFILQGNNGILEPSDINTNTKHLLINTEF